MLVHYGNSMAACGPPVGGKFVLSAIQRWLDRFCYKHPRFGIPNLMLVIVVGSALVWLLDQFSYGVSLSGLPGLFPYYILHGRSGADHLCLCPHGQPPLFPGHLPVFLLHDRLGAGAGVGHRQVHVFYGLGVVLNIVVGFVLYAVSALPIPPACWGIWSPPT